MSEPIQPNELPNRCQDTAQRIRIHHIHDGEGHFSYTKSTDSGIGVAYYMICDVCAKFWDLTDYGSW